ncbi:MAG TPA: hypothetical protein VK939_12125 [Longimicrobiales bacterium]|nr:hypothetical protein [Longimicrobiales bacterium]
MRWVRVPDRYPISDEEVDVVEWLVPICFFWILTSLIIGGSDLEIRGGAVQQLLGLVLTFAIYLLVWALVRMVARGTGVTTSVLIATAVASLLLPVLTRIGFRITGVRLSKLAAH